MCSSCVRVCRLCLHMLIASSAKNRRTDRIFSFPRASLGLALQVPIGPWDDECMTVTHPLSTDNSVTFQAPPPCGCTYLESSRFRTHLGCAWPWAVAQCGGLSQILVDQGGQPFQNKGQAQPQGQMRLSGVARGPEWQTKTPKGLYITILLLQSSQINETAGATCHEEVCQCPARWMSTTTKECH